jgi:REP element-mobilizing transposase RayT
MPYTELWVHLVWATKLREPWLTSEIRPKLFRHIRAYAKSKGIYLDTIGGYTDHVHCLIRLDEKMSACQAVKLIKGESSRWMNRSKFFPQKFRWQSEYYAASVNSELLFRYRGYIAKQEQHHSTQTLKDELKILKRNPRMAITKRHNE